jgi:CelD/BcsL family acetyltransferase involved in cellulose biosynthesis
VSWESLADRVAAPPFLREGWYEAWLAAFGGGEELELLEVSGGVLPLLVSGRVARAPANTHTHLYGPVAADDAAAEALARELASRRYERVLLPYMDPSTPFARACLELWPRRRIVHVMQRSPYVALDGDFDAWRAGLERKFRKELGRLRRRLSELGELTFDFGCDLADLDEGFRLEASGWKLGEGTAIVQKPSRVRFYRELASWARERGTLQLAFARLDGRPIAFDFCLDDGASVYALKGGFDREMRRHGPGFLLTEEGIARAYAGGRRTYELLGDADEYKLNFTSTTRERIHFEGFSGSPGGRARHVARARVRPLLKRLRGV